MESHVTSPASFLGAFREQLTRRARAGLTGKTLNFGSAPLLCSGRIVILTVLGQHGYMSFLHGEPPAGVTGGRCHTFLYKPVQTEILLGGSGRHHSQLQHT